MNTKGLEESLHAIQKQQKLVIFKINLQR